MGNMKAKASEKVLSQEDIDQLVIAQAEDDDAWETPIQVQPPVLATLALPAELARRAAVMARLHRTTNVAQWLVQIIQERLDFEEAIYIDVKQDLRPAATKKSKKSLTKHSQTIL
jgi:hypothetical protein